jgi:hypothetical protein
LIKPNKPANLGALPFPMKTNQKIIKIPILTRQKCKKNKLFMIPLMCSPLYPIKTTTKNNKIKRKKGKEKQEMAFWTVFPFLMMLKSIWQTSKTSI